MPEQSSTLHVSNEALVIMGARFHLVWLRDNCPCQICRDAATTQKLFDITATDLAPRMRSHALLEGALCIVWEEEPLHESYYELAWLQQHIYDPPAEATVEPLELWQASTWRATPLTARLSSDAAWREDVYRYGVSLLTGLDQTAYEALLHELGPLQPTEFGQITPLRARPDANDIGETGLPLDPHTDYTVYMHFPPTLNLLHCLRNDSDGGVSVLVDGFAVAEHLRVHDRPAFDLLVRTPLPFHQVYHRWRYHHLRHRPMIELDERGAVCGVHVGQVHTRNWSLPFEQMPAFYAAYASFLRLLNDRAWQLHHRLQPGECFAFRNERVLHGRTGFSPQTGERHLQIAYVCWSYFTARDRYERAEQAEHCDIGDNLA